IVSKASDDLPEPLSPVITVRVLRGISTLMFFRLCCRAPLTVILVIPMVKRHGIIRTEIHYNFCYNKQVFSLRRIRLLEARRSKTALLWVRAGVPNPRYSIPDCSG